MDAQLPHGPALALARERAAFESRMSATRPELPLTRASHDPDAAYADPRAQAFWEGWSERADCARKFPISGAPDIPWRAIEGCDRQARSVHGASLEELALSGGLDVFCALDLLRSRAAGHHRVALNASVDLAREELARVIALVDGPVAPPGWAIVPNEPSEALLMSMALRLDHGLGAPGMDEAIEAMTALLPAGTVARTPTRARRVEVALNDMRKVHEEVVGKGFHNRLDESLHAGLLAQARRPAP